MVACGTASYACMVGALLVRAAGRPAGRPRHRLGVPLPRHAAGAGQRCAVRLAVRRDHGHAGGDALRQGAGAQDHRAGQRAREHAGARGRLPCCRTLAGPEIGVASTKAFTTQLATLACLAVAAARARGAPRRAEREAAADPGARRGAGARRRGAAARTPSYEQIAHELVPCPRRALSRPRHQLPDRAGGRAEAQGDQLHPRRGLCRRRAEARADRADRRERAGDRGGAARPRCSTRPRATCRRSSRAAAR